MPPNIEAPASLPTNPRAPPIGTPEWWDYIAVDYDRAYAKNEVKDSCVEDACRAIFEADPILGEDGRPLPIGPAYIPRVLDLGCGTGEPVGESCTSKGLRYLGVDFSQSMVTLAQHQVPNGKYALADMRTFEPPVVDPDTGRADKFAGVFLLFSHLGLSYAEFSAVAFRAARALRPGGVLVVGQCPADHYYRTTLRQPPKECPAYIERLPIPFLGAPFKALCFSESGMCKFLESMGLEIEASEAVEFWPRKADEASPYGFSKEHQQFIIAQLPEGKSVSRPRMDGV